MAAGSVYMHGGRDMRSLPSLGQVPAAAGSASMENTPVAARRQQQACKCQL